jgi:hypothetical protein
MDTPGFPDIEFGFFDVDHNGTVWSSKVVTMTLNPWDYMVVDKEYACEPGFGDHGTNYGWNLGVMFLKRFIMVYDFQNSKVGFVRSHNLG